MSANLDELIVSAQKVVDEYLQKVVDAKKAVNALATLDGRPPVYNDIESVSSMGVGNIRQDQFFGMGVATASAEYLKMKGSSATAQEILNGLISGGFQFPADWQEKYRLKNLAISLKKNTGKTGKFVYLDSSKTFGLPEFYKHLKRVESKKELYNKLSNPDGFEDIKDEEEIITSEDDKTILPQVGRLSKSIGMTLNDNKEENNFLVLFYMKIKNEVFGFSKISFLFLAVFIVVLAQAHSKDFNFLNESWFTIIGDIILIIVGSCFMAVICLMVITGILTFGGIQFGEAIENAPKISFYLSILFFILHRFLPK